MSIFFLLSGCAHPVDKQLVEDGQQQMDTRENFERNYSHGVDFDTDYVTGKNIVLRPHIEEISFFDNGPTTNIWTFGTGKSPLVIHARQGEVLNVVVHNEIGQETSVHWHGVRVPNDQDGVPGVTQDPIPVSGSYNYRVPLQDPGTFFFHPHINTVEQMGRGLYGILIVEPQEYPFTYDRELVRALKDYRLNNDGTLNEDFEGLMDFTHGGRLGNVLTINNLQQPIEKVKVGETVLLRLINPSNARIYNLNLEKWDAKIVATDGGYVSQPYTAKIVQLGPGERIELLLTMNAETLDLYDSYFPSRLNKLASIQPVFSDQENVGVIQDINNSLFPDIPDWSSLGMNEPDEIIDLGGMGVMGGDRGLGEGDYRGWTIDDGVWPHTNHVLEWDMGTLRVVRLQNKSRRDHPMHLHGDFFQVIGVNGNDVPWLGRKDTINVPAQGYIDLAILPTNPGTRMFHCHIIEHAHYGMMTTVIVE